MLERTLVILKPDAVQRKLCGKIISIFEEAGFNIVDAKFTHASKELVERHYPNNNKWYTSVGNKSITNYQEQGLDIKNTMGTDDPLEIGKVVKKWLVEYMTSDARSSVTDLRRKNGREEPWRLKYFGIGNENWNCGGRMRAEYYADEMNRYNLYARDYGENRLYRIAAGPRNANYKWTEVLMRDASMYVDAIALHYYTRVGDKIITTHLPDGNERYYSDDSRSRKSATEFGEEDWFGIMKAAAYTEELIAKHTAIMDRYDPDKRTALVVDEWGTWFDNEPGPNPGFLYQQNTLRDAVSAAVSLNIFNNHSDRVHMANIAQTVNVLQAVILTEGERMLLTPTYHVFDMYKVHQDADLLDFAMLSDDYVWEGERLHQISASVSRDAAGKLHMTLANVNPDQAAEVTCHIGDFDGAPHVEGSVLTAAAMNARNTFEQPEQVKPQAFADFTVEGCTLHIQMPAKSVVLLTVS